MRCHAERSRSGSSRALPPGSRWSRWDRARCYLSVIDWVVSGHAWLDMSGCRLFVGGRGAEGLFGSIRPAGDYVAERGDARGETPDRTVAGAGRAGGAESPTMSRRASSSAVPAVVALVLGMTACDDSRSIGGDDPGPTTLIASAAYASTHPDTDVSGRLASLQRAIDQLRESTGSGWVGRQDDVTGYLGELSGGRYAPEARRRATPPTPPRPRPPSSTSTPRTCSACRPTRWSCPPTARPTPAAAGAAGAAGGRRRARPRRRPGA